MTDGSTDITDVIFERISFDDLPDELQNVIKKAIDSGENPGILMASKIFAQMASEVFGSIVLCTCVSHHCMKDHEKISSSLVDQMGPFIADQAHPVYLNPCDETLSKAMMNIMLRARALAEDALNIKRYDGTAKGEECHLL